MKKQACVLGHFGFGLELYDGQTVKTRIVTAAIEDKLPDDVIKLDTHGGIKSLLKAPFYVLKALKKSKNVVIFPAHNGVRVYAPLLSIFRPLFKGRKLHYVVIGGWLSKFIEKKRFLRNRLKRFDGIYVETQTMKNDLEAQGFENIILMPNCKKLTPLSSDELVYQTEPPYRLCTFSRVMKEKGIEDAINAVRKINQENGKTVYTLDIYGPVDVGQTEWFENLKKEMPEYVKYCGIVDFSRSVETLKDYFALLFPTRFYTEGIPGTILDAYAAGIPVISARWQSFNDIVDDGVTGIGYEFENTEEFKNILSDIAANVNMANSLKVNCLEKSKMFLPEEVITILLDRF